MSSADRGPTRGVFLIDCADGSGRYVIYNASEIGNPGDHLPDKWYAHPYPVPVGFEPGHAFDSAEEAELAIRSRPGMAGPIDAAVRDE